MDFKLGTQGIGLIVMTQAIEHADIQCMAEELISKLDKELQNRHVNGKKIPIARLDTGEADVV